MKRSLYLWQCAGGLFLLLTAACGGPITTVTPVAPASGTQPAAAAPATHPAPAGSTSSAPAASAASQGSVAGKMPSSGGPVSLQVNSPQDGAVVTTPQVQVSGTASPGAVVTVNDTIILVGADGGFSATVTLDAGPNLVEVIASNDSGDQKTIDMTVTYQQ